MLYVCSMEENGTSTKTMAVWEKNTLGQFCDKYGVYVEMEGIMEVIRFTCEDMHYDDMPRDFMSFQAMVKEISDEYCHKSKETSEQA